MTQLLESSAKEAMVYWKCKPDGDYLPHGSDNLLWPVVTGTGQKALLKAIGAEDERHSGTILNLYGGRGAVRLIAEPYKNVLLLERLHHPCALTEMVVNGRDVEATQIICDVIADLHASDIASSDLSLFGERLEEISNRQVQLAGPLRGAFQKALELAAELIAAAGPPIALHGDIHHGNIMRSDERGWVAIDPKGIFGPRIYDYCNTLCNPFPHKEIVRSRDRMDRQATIVAGRALVDKGLLLRFTFLHSIWAAASSQGEHLDYWFSCAQSAGKLAGIYSET
jgi:streptomycin 6-kinase